jgi:hypothetical protein
MAFPLADGGHDHRTDGQSSRTPFIPGIRQKRARTVPISDGCPNAILIVR